jgi:hypothetical protein
VDFDVDEGIAHEAVGANEEAGAKWDAFIAEDFDFEGDAGGVGLEEGFVFDLTDAGATEVDGRAFFDAWGVGEGEFEGVGVGEHFVHAAELENEGTDHEEADEEKEADEEFGLTIGIHDGWKRGTG